MTKSINNYLTKEGGRAVDKEMVYKSAVEAVPPDMPEMKEKVSAEGFFVKQLNHEVYLYESHRITLNTLVFVPVSYNQYILYIIPYITQRMTVVFNP